VFRTISGPVSAWESQLPVELLHLPEELAQVDILLDDPVFFAPFPPYFHPVLGRPPTPIECYLRLMFLKFRYQLGYESLCAEVSDSISWRRFCRIRLDGTVPHPTTLMKLTTRCGEAAVAGLNEALWVKAAGAKPLRTARVRADTTVIAANVVYPTDAGLLARAVGRLVQMPDGATRLVSLHDSDARPIRKGRIDRPVEFGYKAQVLDNDDGVVVDYSALGCFPCQRTDAKASIS
jgi:transposase, IS5 family